MFYICLSNISSNIQPLVNTKQILEVPKVINDIAAVLLKFFHYMVHIGHKVIRPLIYL